MKQKENILLFEKSPILLAQLIVAFKKLSAYHVVAACRSEKEAMDYLSNKCIATLIVGNQGCIEIEQIVKFRLTNPTLKIEGVFYDESVLMEVDDNMNKQETKKNPFDKVELQW